MFDPVFSAKYREEKKDERSTTLGKRKHQFKVDNLGRFLIYVLGHRPDEFGLIPDPRGYVPFKELLQAVHEEEGWGYVRRSHINEVLLGKDRSLFQANENRIRVLEKHWEIDLGNPPVSSAGILFTAIRRKAHHVVMEKGLWSAEGRYIILTPEKKMAQRIGKRRDPKPIILEISPAITTGKGARVHGFGNLFITHDIPSKFIIGPPVSKEVLVRREKAKEKKVEEIPIPSDFAPGTFSMDINRDPDPYRRAKGKKRKGWKEEARRMRRRKKR